MNLQLPDPLPIKWNRKSLGSADSGVQIMRDGRLRCWIEHEVVKDVTPEMLVWWFKHLEGTIELDGVAHNRYRVWHPVDHLFAEYEKRNDDGTVGVGSVIHLAEMLGGNPEYLVHISTTIIKLDETGYIHQPRIHGLKLAEMRYTFERVHNGTKYVNSLTVGAKGILGRLINPLIRKFFFDKKRGEAWIRHNIEEVGNFESFLPELYSEEALAESEKRF